ncbi:MAG: 2-amino-4-hydroxy-6-hydroxymethyldihydropteridine diphosphokinase [Desulfuromonadaceae bacterium]|nr:2-amino-4-hydroxy-6-hydroxymethyldihydropteridine diphosphokinase [Desulfuromonadaceae bacterium]
MERTREIALLAFGANLGDRRRTLTGARRALARGGEVEVRRCSRLFESEALGGPPGQPPYLNAVLEVATALAPEELLAWCQGIEQEFGRRRRERWGPRTLDIDILAYDGRVSHDPGLILPHPRLHLRRFVLLPLLEVAPEWRHPVSGKTVSQLVAELAAADRIRPLAGEWG